MTIFALEALRKRLEEKAFSIAGVVERGDYVVEIVILYSIHVGIVDMIEGDEGTIATVLLMEADLLEKNEDRIVDSLVSWIKGERE